MALVYELLWHRRFTLLFGASAPAVATVLAAYFTGLCAGSFLSGRWAHRWSSPLVVYGCLEFVVAAGALLVDPILELYSASYPALIARFGDMPLALLLTKAALAFGAIGLPTMAMGATLPVLALALDAKKESLGSSVAWLYMVNTFGAAVGTLSFPALLLPQLGMLGSTWFCVVVNASLGISSLLLARTFGPAVPSLPKRSPVRSTQWGVLALAFYSGAGVFALQVLWNRAFAQVHENSFSSFALVTGIFILAIAAGGWIARGLLTRKGRRVPGLAELWVLGGGITAITPFIFLWQTNNLSFIPEKGAFPDARLIGVSALNILVPVALLGTSIPFLVQALALRSRHSANRDTGSLLAVNTIGCICGAVLGGFVLPAALGLWKAISVTGAGFLVIGLAFRARSWVGRMAPTAILLLPLIVNWPRVSLDPGESLLALKEGSYGIAAVVQRPDGSRRLKLNNHYVLGGTLSTGDQRMQAHIPMLLAPEGGHVAFLGFGTGITAGAARFHPGFQWTALELAPEVLHLANSYFKEVNGDFRNQPGAKVVVDDARNYLRGTDESFAVVIGDLVVPWRSGESSLYSLEHFRAVKASLAPGGVFCAWVPMFQVNEAEFQMILRTFLQVFDGAYLWRGDFSPHQPAYGIVSAQPGTDPLAGVAQSLARMRPDPYNPQLRSPAALWMHFIGPINRNDLKERAGPVHSENTPWLELQVVGYSRPPRYFVGRELQQWESGIREKARGLVNRLPPEAQAGWRAGGLMGEFTLLLSEGRRREAAAVQSRIRQEAGEELSQLLFGE